MDRSRELLGEIRRKPEKKKRKGDMDFEGEEFYGKEEEEREKAEGLVGMMSEKSVEKKEQENTHHAFSFEQQEGQTDGRQEGRAEVKSGLENEEDKLSINNELVEKIPKYLTKEILYPSNHNLCPFQYGSKVSQFSIFF